MSTDSPPPRISLATAERIAADHFGVRGSAEALPSYCDRNFRIGPGHVLKIAQVAESEERIDLQTRALQALAHAEPGLAPNVVSPTAGNRPCVSIPADDGREHLAWMITWLEGVPLGQRPTEAADWVALGELLARVDRVLARLDPSGAQREMKWDLAQAEWSIGSARRLASSRRRALVERAQLAWLGSVRPRLSELPWQPIHNDANDHNLMIPEVGEPKVVGLLDFGDMVESARVFELAVAGAYAIMRGTDPLVVLGELAAGYDAVLPLEDAELEVLVPALSMRLAISVLMSAEAAAADPDNDYIRVSEAPAWEALERIAELSPTQATAALRSACGRPPGPPAPPTEELLRERDALLGPSLSLAYERPLHIVRGRGTFLFDTDGRAYLDGVNNVCHVGHCHPTVVSAARAQIGELNTNTRYLHGNVLRLARRLTDLFPDHLEVAFFVNSGSEANELALRMARATTGRRGVVAVEHGYHGNTQALIDVSSYKHAGPGGEGPPEHVRIVPCPDTYRGIYREDTPDVAARYASHVSSAVEECQAAAFLAEPWIGCGGQIIPPDGWLRRAFEHARAGGALCIADEVQIGFGRAGSHWWAFEADGAVPDIVTLGKPFGNGHPLAAVVTTRAIAEAFATGMEYFNTFGGNPVSCAIGLAVLDVIENEELLARAASSGDRLREGLEELARAHRGIGQVRGRGLYSGVEFVLDEATREPDPECLQRVIEGARNDGVLSSSDGPYRNVLKIKPPICIDAAEIDMLLAALDRALSH